MQPLEVIEAQGRDCGPEQVRNFACLAYGLCLSLAVDKGWAGFSCQGCGRRHEEREDWAAVQVRDVMRVRRLLAKAIQCNWKELDGRGFLAEIAPDRLDDALRERGPDAGGLAA